MSALTQCRRKRTGEIHPTRCMADGQDRPNLAYHPFFESTISGR